VEQRWCDVLMSLQVLYPSDQRFTLDGTLLILQLPEGLGAAPHVIDGARATYSTHERSCSATASSSPIHARSRPTRSRPGCAIGLTNIRVAARRDRGHGMTLVQSHLEDLKRSGLSDETIARAGIYSAPERQVRDLLGYGVGPGMVIPYPSPSDARVRLDHPDKDWQGCEQRRDAHGWRHFGACAAPKRLGVAPRDPGASPGGAPRVGQLNFGEPVARLGWIDPKGSRAASGGTHSRDVGRHRAVLGGLHRLPLRGATFMVMTS
jgi:hypothetical protein